MSALRNSKKAALDHKIEENEKAKNMAFKELNDELDALEKEIKARIANSNSKSGS